MIVIFSAHAKQRMKERNIDERSIHKCLGSPDKQFSSNGENIFVKRFDQRVIVVIFKRTGDIHYVI